MMRDVVFFFTSSLLQQKKNERSYALCIVVYCASTILPINEFCKMKLFQKRIHNIYIYRTHTKQPPMQKKRRKKNRKRQPFSSS